MEYEVICQSSHKSPTLHPTWSHRFIAQTPHPHMFVTMAVSLETFFHLIFAVKADLQLHDFAFVACMKIFLSRMQNVVTGHLS